MDYARFPLTPLTIAGIAPEGAPVLPPATADLKSNQTRNNTNTK